MLGVTKEYKEWREEFKQHIAKIKGSTISAKVPQASIAQHVDAIDGHESEAKKCIGQMEHEYNGLPPNTKKELQPEISSMKDEYNKALAQINAWKKEQGVEEEEKMMDDCLNVAEKIMENTKGSMSTLQEQSVSLLHADNNLNDVGHNIHGSKQDIITMQRAEFLNKILLIIIAGLLLAFELFYGLRKLSII